MGFEPVTALFGFSSILGNQQGFYSSGYNIGEVPIRAYASSPVNQRVGTPPKLVAMRRAITIAMTRVLQDATKLGAHGVIGLEFDQDYEHEDGTSYLTTRMRATAVRATGRWVGPGVPFTTSLSGARVAAAVRGGLVPVSWLYVPCMAIRHIDVDSANAMRRTSPNNEITAATEVVTLCRERARADFEAAARRTGADSGHIEDISLQLSGAHTMGGHCTATVVITGNAMAHFRPPVASPKPLPILRLNRGSRL